MQFSLVFLSATAFLSSASALRSSSTSDEEETTRKQPEAGTCGRRRHESIPLEHFPTIRYRLWETLSPELQGYAQMLDYSEDAWNEPGTNKIEKLSYWSNELTKHQQDIIREMGFGGKDKDAKDEGGWDIAGYVWDCYVSHYNDYTWRELKEEGVQQYWIQMGWNMRSWRSKIAAPASRDKSWNELSAQEQEAAENLCWFQETWDDDVVGLKNMKKWSFTAVA